MIDLDDAQLDHDLSAEIAVLGAMMLSADATGRALEALKSRDFRRGAHQLVFEAIESLAMRSMPVDPVTVADELDKQGALPKVGGVLTLHDIVAAVPTATNVGYYVGQVYEASVTRSTLEAAARVGQIMANRHVDLDDRVDAVRGAIDEATRLSASASAQSVAEVIGPLMDRIGSKAPVEGVTTGWADLDSLFTRLRPGQLIIVGARPGMGKSVFMINMALHVRDKLGLPVLFASLEMTKDEITMRMVSAMARANLHMLQRGDLSDQEWMRAAEVSARLAEYDDLVIDDNSGTTIAHLSAAIRRMRRNGTPPALVVVDYLQLMGSGRRSESRQVEVSALSRALKQLAGEFGIPIVVGSQLNRESEKRADKRPSTADLRESGGLENDADVIILLHREDAYNKESPRAGELEVIVSKHRQGPTATITLAWQGHYARAVDFAADPQGDGRPNLHNAI